MILRKSFKVPLVIFTLCALFNSCGRDGDCEKFFVVIKQLGTDQLTVEIHNGVGPFTYKWSNGLGDFPTITVSQTGDYTVVVSDHGTNCGSSSSFSFKASTSGDCGSFTAVTDEENNTYDIVTIGDQCWMITNLNKEAGIQKVTDANEWNTTTSPAWAYYDNDVNNGPKFGKLYNGYAVSSGKICPVGWHIPSVEEWEKLFQYLKGDSLASISLRKMDPLWIGNVHATNESRFSALPGGRRQINGSFFGFGTQAHFWASDKTSLGAKAIVITTSDGIHRSDWGLNYGMSCRCVKD